MTLPTPPTSPASLEGSRDVGGEVVGGVGDDYDGGGGVGGDEDDSGRGVVGGDEVGMDGEEDEEVEGENVRGWDSELTELTDSDEDESSDSDSGSDSGSESEDEDEDAVDGLLRVSD